MPQPALPFDDDPAVPAPVYGAVGTETPSRVGASAAQHLCAPAPAQLAPLPAPRTSDPAPVFARHPRARRYVVRVKADGTVRVTIPRWGSKRGAAAFADQQREWIEKQLRRVEKERAAPHEPMPVEQLRLLRGRAQRELPPRLLTLAESLGLTVVRISVRNQRWRWGSCSRRGHICLNWRLVTMPDWVRDYVLVHELMHLKRMDHSPKFWKLVAAVCPTFEDARAWLRMHQDMLSH